MRESLRTFFQLPDRGTTPWSLALVIAAVGGTLLIENALFPRNVAILFVIPLLLAALSSPPWVIAVVAMVALLDGARHVGPGQPPPDATWVAVTGLVVGSLALFLAWQRSQTASLWQAARREAGERERALTLLAESEARFRLLADATPALIGLAGLDMGCTYFNRTWLDFTGRTLEQELGVGWLEGVHPDDAPPCVARYVAAFDARSEFTLEYRLRHRDGTYRWVIDRGAPYYTSGGQFAGYVCASTDISALKQAENDLRQSRDQFAVILGGIDDGVVAFGPDGNLVYANDAAARMAGYPAAEQLLQEGSRAHVLTNFAVLNASGQAFPADSLLQDAWKGVKKAPVTLRYRKNADGDERLAVVQAAPVPDGAGVIQMVICIVRDVTAQAQADLARRQLAAIVESSDDAINSTALDGTVVSWNAGAERMFGYTADEMVGRSIAILHPPDRTDEMARIHHQISRGEAVDHFQAVLLRKNGTRLPVSLTISPIRNPDGQITGSAAIARDVSAQVEAYESLERQVAARTRELTTLLASSHAIASTLDLPTLLGLILDQLRNIADCTVTHIFSRGTDELVLLDYRGPLPRAQVLPFRFSLSPEARAALVDRALSIVVDDVLGPSEAAACFQRALGGQPTASFDGARAWMWIPLKVKGQVVGGLSLSHETPGHFTQRHQALAEAIANQAATALENARLYEEAQRLAVLRERQRLAHDLHDAVTQTLFSMGLIADVLPRLWERRPEEGRQRLDDLRRLTRGALREMRTLLLELRPDGPGEFALGELLRQLTDTMTALVQVPVSLVASGALPPMPAAVHLALYRIAQEALNNAARHAHASQITVRLRGEPDLVEILVRDDGRGFDPARVADGHLGLGIMRERAASVGATMTIDSQIGQGTRVAVVWPVLAPEDRS